MGYLRQFYEEEHFETLTPVSADALSPFGVLTEVDMFSPLAAADVDRRHILIYYNEHTRGCCRIRIPHSDSFHACWFDPRSGQRKVLDAPLYPADGYLDCPGRPAGGDWLFTLQA